MMYVDQAFPISGEDVMMETSYAINNRPLVKEIALAVSLFIFGVIGILLGVFMTYNHIGSDRNHGFYYTRIAYFAYKGYKGFFFASIPPL